MGAVNIHDVRDRRQTSDRQTSDVKQHHCLMPAGAEQAVREAATICPAPVTLTFDLLTLKVVSESRVTWATTVPILVFLGISVLDLGPIYATDRRQTDSQMSDKSIA